MNKEDTKRAIAVMQAWLAGKKIECMGDAGMWYTATSPTWDWYSKRYRIKPEPRTLYTVLGEYGGVVYSDFDRKQAELVQNKYTRSTIMESKEVL